MLESNKGIFYIWKCSMFTVHEIQNSNSTIYHENKMFVISQNQPYPLINSILFSVKSQ